MPTAIFSDKEIIIMEEQILLEECPICRGAGMIMHEGGWSVQVECTDCSAHTVYMEYDNEDEKAEAVQAVVHLWNIGKVVSSERGE
jgi:hypothetical protein